MNLLRAVLAFLLLSSAAGASLAEDASPRQAAVAVSPAQMAAAVSLVRTLHLEQYMQSTIESLAPPGMKRDIMTRIIMQRIDMRQFETFIGKIYAETFSEEELRQLVAFFDSELGKKLQSKQAVLQRNVTEAFANSPEFMAKFMVSGCAAGIVASSAEQARQFQISTGQPPPTLDSIFQNIGPLLAKAETSCTCMVDKAMAAAKSKDPSKIFQDPAVKQAVDDAFKSGACPRPL